MKRKTRKRIIVISLSITILIVLGVLAYLFYWTYAYPAYISLYADCYSPTYEPPIDSGYVKGGEFVINKSSNTTQIRLYINDTSIIRHEICHETQYYEHRLYSCNNPVYLYINELECYIRS